MYIKRLFLLLFILLVPTILWSQKELHESKQKSSNKAVKKLSKSLEENKSNDEIALDYVQLAKDLAIQNEYAKSENYLTQAVNLYRKGKNTELLANAYRELAKVQEAQNKFDLATTNYSNAVEKSRIKAFKEINLNDANRLKSRTNPRKRSDYIQKNIDISNLSNNKEEAAISHQQMAQAKLDMDDKQGAIDELENALKNVEAKSEKAIEIKQAIAQTYISDEQYEKAIIINEALVNEAQKVRDPKIEIEQLQNLANSYLEANERRKGIEALKQAYELAVGNDKTMEARKTLLLLVEQYEKDKKNKEALNIYADFIGRLDTLIRSDSTLIDAKVFQIHEDRISHLEHERALKDELIARKNRFNYVLLGSIGLILVFMAFIGRALYSINKKNKKIALQSLRREMNPHFIFNSLNSVNQFIAQSNELEANKYLTSYSKLMRNMMENSNKDFISLTTEIEQLKKYLELEHLRFRDKFTYQIIIDDSLDTDAIYIPNMLIQPQLENAIWHGLRYKEEGGLLILAISQEKEIIKIIVDDNGIGLQKSRELKTKHQKQHNSRGLTNTYERIYLLNELYTINISMEITEKEGDEAGVIVSLQFPLTNKNRFEHATENKKRHC